MKKLTDRELWELHLTKKKELMETVIKRTGIGYDSNRMIITWARRLADYKQPRVIFENLERTLLSFMNEVFLAKCNNIGARTKTTITLPKIIFFLRPSTINSDRKKIIGYGAAAKANTLLNYFEIDSKILDYIIDDSPLKQNLYTPGSHIKILSSKKVFSDKPDYILILAWNFADAIIKKLSDYKKRGGYFILPVPKPQII